MIKWWHSLWHEHETCRYCECKRAIVDESKRLELRIVYGNKLIADVYDKGPNINVKINYCPMCGRKLGS